MKSIIGILLLCFTSTVIAQPVKIDSAYTYASSDDSCIAYLVCKHGVSTYCDGLNPIIEKSGDTVKVYWCYEATPLAIYCTRKDTICLGNLNAGSYTISVTVDLSYGPNCTSIYKSVTKYAPLILSPLSISGPNAHSYSLFPNPTHNQLHCSTSSRGNYTIYNIGGTVAIPSASITNSNFDINVSMLSNGVYYMVIEDDSQHSVRRFIKQ